MSASSVALGHPARLAPTITAFFLKALHALIAAPEYIFLIALSAMLFSPPDLQAFPADRVAFLVLITVGSVRFLSRWERLQTFSASWPMLALLLFGLRGAVSQPYDPRVWSVFAAQWIVPVAMFHFAATIFGTPEAQRKLQWFSVAVLLYLSLTAVIWLADFKSFILPRFILDESVGIHFDRARGPFLQAVANGVCINLLAIVALHAFDGRTADGHCRSRFPIGQVLVPILAVLIPLALLATKTRGVWLGAVLSAVLIMLFARQRPSRILLAAVLLIAATTSLAWLLQTKPGELSDRLLDRSPVEFRLDMYRAGWQMFTEKSLLGWGADANIQPEMERRLSSFHPEYYIFHNTYLQLAVQHGALGLLMYICIFIAFFRLGRRRKLSAAARGSPFGPDFGVMWRVMLCVYLLNASVVVMNYQFLNGYMFTIAGILAARQGQEKAENSRGEL